MLSINNLKKYLENKHGIFIRKEQIKDLQNIGYYHGYKGYRFIRTSNQRISFSSFDEIIALNQFDLDLKATIYPKIMLIENAFKSYVIEAVVEDCKAEDLDSVFDSSINYYKSFSKGSENYHKEYEKRMKLKGLINNTLLRDYSNKRFIVNHFFDSDREIPIWAVFESLSLGEFGAFYACSNLSVKKKTSQILNLPTNLDSDGKMIEYRIYTIKDLRNAIAHNNIIFDTRFQSVFINNRLIRLLEKETTISNINFSYICSYIILLTYILLKMGKSKQECEKFVTDFGNYTEQLRLCFPQNACNQIFGTQQRSNLIKLNDFIRKY